MSKLFDENSTQDELYESIGKNAFHDFIEGYDTSIFSYGILGSGKTYSMIGTDEVRKYLIENINGNANLNMPFSIESKLGIIPRICMDIINQIDNLKLLGNICKLKVSYIENYLNSINCLISGKKNIFKGWGNSKDEIKYKDGLEPKLIECKTINDIMNIISKGLKNMKITTLDDNINTNRSHTFLILDLHTTYLDGSKTHQKMLLGDLAGSERVNKIKIKLKIFLLLLLLYFLGVFAKKCRCYLFN
jgi:hypothetical protein